MSSLQIRIPELPVQWKRMLGQNRFKHEALCEWQALVAEAVREAAEIEGAELPFKTPVHVSISVVLDEYEPETQIDILPWGGELPQGFGQFLRRDSDNTIKAIFDALKDVAWPDDCLKYIPSHRFALL